MTAPDSGGGTRGGAEAAGLNDMLTVWAGRMKERGGAGGLPVLPGPQDADPSAGPEVIVRARCFHRGEGDGACDLEPPGPEFVPALLFPFRDPGLIRHDYPLFLFPPSGADDGRLCARAADVFRDLVGELAPGTDGVRILEDNLPRLERRLGVALEGAQAAIDAAGAITAAGRSMVEELSLRPEPARQLDEILSRLTELVPEGATLLALGDATVLRLFVTAARHHLRLRRAPMAAEAARLRRALLALRRVARRRAGSGENGPGAALGPVGEAYLDPEALAKLLDSVHGAEPMSPARLARIERVISILERGPEWWETDRVTVVHAAGADLAGGTDDLVDWSVSPEGLFRGAAAMFDGQAERWAEYFGAMRVARLEVEHAYDPSRHDGLLEAFGWESFTPSELGNLPPVVVLGAADHLAGGGMADLSRLLRSGRPVHVIVPVHPALDPGAGPEGDPLAGHRFELSYLGISHREAYVHQSSAARPDHLAEGFRRSLGGTTASLHVVTSGLTGGGEGHRLGAWLHAGAALEGRAHPFFRYDPEAGATWARRFDFSENPRPEADWPVYDLPCRGADGADASLRLAFTFADFALLEEPFREHFRVLPEISGGDDLVALDEYLALPPDVAGDRIPFIRAVDGEGRLRRLVVSRPLVLACRDRLDFWRTLQELAGVRNEHVREAVERERERQEVLFAKERTALAEERERAIEEARAGAAREALAALARNLLGIDPAALPAAFASPPAATEALAAPAPAADAGLGGPPPDAKPGGPPTVEAPPPEAAPGGDDGPEEEPEEAWIQSALCTSCNDCLEINARLFVYNGNKQAVIGDVTAGTFAEMVKAAELCPVRCIHPGRPLDPDEPDLEELIERAKPFD